MALDQLFHFFEDLSSIKGRFHEMLKNAINYREAHYHFSLSLEWTLNFKIIHYDSKGSI